MEPDAGLPRRHRIGIVTISSTRPGRFANGTARWLVGLDESRSDRATDLIDLRDGPLSFLGEPGGSAEGAAGCHGGA